MKCHLKCGVNQGSILGPLLFPISINDLSDVCKCSLSTLIADDANLFYHGTDLPVISNSPNKELADVSKWLKAHKLSLNIKKNHYMIFREQNQTVNVGGLQGKLEF